jgi:hypothetical protein
MPKSKKPEIKSPKLYHGTTEVAAKLACVKGLLPSEWDNKDSFGIPRKIRVSSASSICLTSSYPGIMSFETANSKDKWGILEIDISHLSGDLFYPYEGFLLEKTKSKLMSEEDLFNKLDQIRQTLSSNSRQWRDSLDSFGMCVYEGNIPVSAISKVVIYDPMSNPAITKAIVSSFSMNSRFYPVELSRQLMLTRWLLGDNVATEEWVGSEVYAKLQHSEKDKLNQVLLNKNGLDIFHSSPPNGKKISWW